MSKIRILSDALASQVAAGEVVERPASVIRELVQNSLDAGARQITVEVQQAGSALIRVSDDGSGMNREDALMCMERHATSKIRTKEDLEAIASFGFRGEALPSIASVSRFRLVTREHEAMVGTEVEIHGGKLLAVREQGCSAGTMIEARALFFNVPARRKFLRSEATEYGHIEQQFVVHALAHPTVAWTLLRDGAVMHHFPASTHGPKERIASWVGAELAGRLLEVPRLEHEGIAVHGFIGGIGVSRSTREMQVTFLNGRPVESPSINYGLREGFQDALMKGQHAVAFLFLQMDPAGYDINVHPAKREVRFREGRSVQQAVARAVAEALRRSQVLPTGIQSRPMRPGVVAAEPSAQVPASAVAEVASASVTAPEIGASPAVSTSQGLVGKADDFLVAEPVLLRPPVALAPSEPAMPLMPEVAAASLGRAVLQGNAALEAQSLRVLGVIHRLFVVLESPRGLVLMDQHAAHERVNFEKMNRALAQGAVATQRLLMPLTLQVTTRDALILEENLETLARLGVELEPFGKGVFKVEALPAFLKVDDPLQWLDQVVEELQSLAGGRGSGTALRLAQESIAKTVCRRSVKANDRLAEAEIAALLRDLFACELPHCCPHGRPTLIEMPMRELEKRFGRLVS